MRVRPLSMIALGVVVVALDLRVVALDVLPDALGWLLVAAGASRLATGPTVLALVAAVASAADVVAPHHREALDPVTGEVVANPRPGLEYPERLVFDRLDDLRWILAVVAVVAGTLALWVLLCRLARAAAATGDDAASRLLDRIHWAVLGLWTAPFVVVAVVQLMRDGGLDPVWNEGLELVALIGLAVAGAVTWVLAVSHNRSWALGPFGDRTSERPPHGGRPARPTPR